MTMRILVLGAGGIGGYFGARLIEAGADVGFLVRSQRAQRLAEEGLRVISPNGDFAQPVRTVIAPEAPYDLVIVSCKAYDLDSAIAAIAPAVGPQTRVLPLLNGLAHLDALDAAFGAERVLGGFAHISVTLRPDGAIEQFGAVARLVFGERDPGATVPAAISDVLRSMRAEVIESPAILDLMWQKFAFIASLAGATCLWRGSVGEINATPVGGTLIARLYTECCMTAERSGHALTDAMRTEARGYLLAARSPLKASMLRDIERGGPTEGEQILGDLLRRAQAHGVDAPILAAAATHLRVYALQASSQP